MVDFILRILDMFQWLFKALKVDYPTFRLILWAKLTMDNRQEKSVAQRRGKKEMSNAMVWVVFIYAFIGIFVGIMVLGIKSVFVAMVFVFAMVMVMTAVALISDFTSVLLDTTDNAILLPRPVDGRTLAVARLIHIALYLLLITLSLSAASLVIGTGKYGLFFLLSFLVTLIFTVLFVVFTANLFYLWLMKIAGGEHFRDIILYFQIFMAAFAMGSYQLLPRMLHMDALLNLSFPIKWWTYLVPPAWMASIVDLAVNREFTGAKLALAALGILVPLACIGVVVRFLAPGFNQAIATLETQRTKRRDAGPTAERPSPKRLMSRLWSRDPQERGVFRLCWSVTSRDRKFKLKTYPTFGYMLIIGFILSGYTREAPLLETLQNIPQTRKYIIFLYIGCILIPTVLLQQRFSDQYEAAWIFRTLPFVSPGSILKGSFKAMVAKYGTPVFAFLAFLVFLIWGPHTLDDIVLAFLNMILASLVIAYTVMSDLPFSKKYLVGRDAQRGITGFLLFIIPAGAGLIHFGLSYVPYGTLAGIVFSLAAVLVGMSLYGRVNWDRISP